MIALYESLHSGQGQHLDISAQQAVAQATQSTLLAAPLGDADSRRMSGGAKLGDIPIRLVWPAKDGHVAITYLFGSAIAHFTQRLMDWMCEEGFCDEATRDQDWVGYGDYLFGGSQEAIDDYLGLTQLVERFTTTKTKAELLDGALERGLLIAPITTTQEVVDSPQLAAREYWQTLEHPELGQRFSYPGPFAKFSASPITYRRRPPTIGEHNTEIYRDELGFSQQQLAELKSRGIIT